jgi:DNA-binding transcriptional LysR family regulator
MGEPRITLLRAFTLVVDHGGFRKVEADTGYSERLISQRIKALRESLGGVALFERGDGGRLTAAGRVLLPHARRIIREWERAVLAVDNVAQSRKAAVTIRLGLTDSISAFLSPNVQPAFLRAWPGTNLIAKVELSSIVRARVKDGSFDLGLVLEAAAPNTRQQDPARLATGKLALFAAYGSIPNAPMGTEQLFDREIYVADSAGGFFNLMTRYFREDQFYKPKVYGTGTTAGVMETVERTPGSLGLLPMYAVRSALDASRFVLVPLRRTLPNIELRVVWASGERSRRAEALVEAFRSISME